MPPFVERDDHSCPDGNQWFTCRINGFSGCCGMDPCNNSIGCLAIRTTDFALAATTDVEPGQVTIDDPTLITTLINTTIPGTKAAATSTTRVFSTTTAIATTTLNPSRPSASAAPSTFSTSPSTAAASSTIPAETATATTTAIATVMPSPTGTPSPTPTSATGLSPTAKRIILGTTIPLGTLALLSLLILFCLRRRRRARKPPTPPSTGPPSPGPPSPAPFGLGARAELPSIPEHPRVELDEKDASAVGAGAGMSAIGASETGRASEGTVHQSRDRPPTSFSLFSESEPGGYVGRSEASGTYSGVSGLNSGVSGMQHSGVSGPTLYGATGLGLGVPGPYPGHGEMGGVLVPPRPAGGTADVSPVELPSPEMANQGPPVYELDTAEPLPMALRAGVRLEARGEGRGHVMSWASWEDGRQEGVAGGLGGRTGEERK
ncbi:hypothetical protein EJ06DRAFT_555770 [Trichodelitschia bisporula]|uniref:Uncharacterized protein n=1 Tax=Trichodelitschia bisporula TaxID=703511 RepID=A0A6G1HZ11_9PEZI|nr:hypothetical protein EJ06DRAFT_555770 [Trichodelitschia bisporula]